MEEKCPHCNGTGIATDHALVGLRLKGLREHSRIGLRDMARRIGVSHGFLCQLESGRRKWTPLVEIRYLKQVDGDAPGHHLKPKKPMKTNEHNK